MNTLATSSRQALAKKRLILLLLGMICLLFFGLVYGYSMFVKSMTTDFALADIGPLFYVLMICFCLGNLGSSFLLKRIEPRVLLAIAAVLYAVDFCCTGFRTAQFGVIILYVFYAVIGGFASGAGYTAVVGTVTLWFPDKTGLASGVLLLGFGVSSLLLGNGILALRSVMGSIGPIFIGVGVLGGLFGLALAALIKRPPENIVHIMCEDADAPAAIETLDPSTRFENDNVLKTPIFLVFFLAMLLVAIIGLGVIGSVAADGMSIGLAEGFASALVGFAAACNGMSRIIIGTLMDKKGVPFAFTIAEAIGTVGIVCALCGFIFAIPALYVVGVLLGSFTYGGNPVLGSTFTRVRFGAKQYPKNLAIVNFVLFFGAMINIVITMIFGANARLAFFIISSVAVACAFLLTFVVRRMWERDFAESENDQQAA